MSSFRTRKSLYRKIEAARGSKVLSFITGDRPGLETQISKDAIAFFVDHLDAMWPCRKISLILYTNGGDTAAAWQLVNLLRTFSDEFEVIVPTKALSAGTLISLGADTIVMTKQASLGPIDPSLTSPLGPMMPPQYGGAPVAVSVEAVQGFIDVVKDQLKVTDASALASVWNNLSDKIHPLVLGQIFRTRSQIRNLARKLLALQGVDAQKMDEIIAFLCSDSGSHDHTINRREAAAMGLKIEKATEEEYGVLRQLTHSFAQELNLREPFRPDVLVAGNHNVAYSLPRLLIESVAHGTTRFLSEGNISFDPATGIVSDSRTFEGWR